MYKRILSLALFLTIILGLTTMGTATAMTTPTTLEQKANVLKDLGLFQGTNAGLELDRAPTRVEGAVMLLRLIGKEQEAKNSNYENPFIDVPSWADKQVSYMYAKNLTTGISSQLFGAEQEMTASQYVTFVLRALGYSDSENDFKWQTSIDKATEIGLISDKYASDLKKKDTFLRGDVAGISYDALNTAIKGAETTLIEKLVLIDKVIPAKTAKEAGVWNENQDEKTDIPKDDETAISLPLIENPCDIAKEYLSQNGLAYTMTDALESIDGDEYHLTLLFHIKNTIYPQAPQEQDFKIYYSDGTTRYQAFQYEQVRSIWASRRIQINSFDGKRVLAIELGPDISSTSPEKDTLKWDIKSVVEQAVTKGDSEPPRIENIELLQTSVSANEKITIRAHITDKVGVKSAEILFSDPKGPNSEGATTVISFNLNQIPGTDIWEGDYTIGTMDTEGIWKLNVVLLEDNLYNSVQIKAKDLPELSFTIEEAPVAEEVPFTMH